MIAGIVQILERQVTVPRIEASQNVPTVLMRALRRPAAPSHPICQHHPAPPSFHIVQHVIVWTRNRQTRQSMDRVSRLTQRICSVEV